MMLRLILNVLYERCGLRLADRKAAVASLPSEAPNSLAHFSQREEWLLSVSTNLDICWVRDKRKKACTWSAVPPMVMDGEPESRRMPPTYACVRDSKSF